MIRLVVVGAVLCLLREAVAGTTEEGTDSGGSGGGSDSGEHDPCRDFIESSTCLSETGVEDDYGHASTLPRASSGGRQGLGLAAPLIATTCSADYNYRLNKRAIMGKRNSGKEK